MLAVVLSGGCVDGAGSGPTSSAGDAAAFPWATWPMPNAPLPGLPHPHSYDVSSDDAVVDRVTGLVWQRRVPNEYLTFEAATRACGDLSLLGQRDWRLPSRIELVSLLDTTRIEPSIDLSAFPGTESDWFWTASAAAGNAGAAWYVYFYFGYPNTDTTDNRFSVRCVRNAKPRAAPPAHYAVDDQVVRDVFTGLRWQRATPSPLMSLVDARDYCEALLLAGEKGWRLPSLTELATIVDETAVSGTAIDREAFPDTGPQSYWSGSTFAGGDQLAWYVRFDSGEALYGRPQEPLRARCVK